MSFHSQQTVIHVLQNYTFADEAARLAATGFVPADVGKVALQTDNLSFYILADDAPIVWSPLAGAGAGVGDFSAVTTNQVPFNVGSQVFEDAGASVDPATKVWTFESSIVVPQASVELSDTLAISEATFELFVRNSVLGISSVGTLSALDPNLGSGPLIFNQLPSIQTVIAQPDFSQNLTANPLVVPLLATFTNQTDAVTIKTGAAMTNFRATIVDDLTGIVVKYIPSKAVVQSGTGGLNLRAGDNRIDFNNDLTDDPANGLFYIGFTPLRQFAAQASTFTIEADSVNILGDITGIPFFENEIHFINTTTVPFTNDVTNVADNYTRLNDDHTSTTATTGGVVVTYDATMVADVLSLAQFTAGVASTSNPVVETDGSATFAQNDLVKITTANGLNDGLYEVHDHTGIFLTVRGVGTVATVEDFTATDFITTEDTGTVTKVNVAIMRTNTSGDWEVGKGSETGITFEEVQAHTAFTEGSVIFADNTGDITEDNANFFWDDTNNFLGIGTNTPSHQLEINSASGSGTIAIKSASGGSGAFILQDSSGTDKLNWVYNDLADTNTVTFSAPNDTDFAVTSGNFDIQVNSGSLNLQTVAVGNIDLTSITTIDLNSTGVININSNIIIQPDGEQVTFTAPNPGDSILIEFRDSSAAQAFALEYDDTGDNTIIEFAGTGGGEFTSAANLLINTVGIVDINTNAIFSATGETLSLASSGAASAATFQLKNSGSANRMQMEYDQATDAVNIDFTASQTNITETGGSLIFEATAGTIELVASLSAAFLNLSAGLTTFIQKTAGDDTTPVLRINNIATNGGVYEFHVGDRTPVGNVTGDGGDVYFREDGVNSNMYIYKSATSNNTDWEAVTTSLDDLTANFVVLGAGTAGVAVATSDDVSGFFVDPSGIEAFIRAPVDDSVTFALLDSSGSQAAKLQYDDQADEFVFQSQAQVLNEWLATGPLNIAAVGNLSIANTVSGNINILAADDMAISAGVDLVISATEDVYINDVVAQTFKDGSTQSQGAIPDGSRLDTSTLIEIGTLSSTGIEPNPAGVYMRADGLKMYMIGPNNDNINEYDLSVAFDVTSGVFLQAESIAANAGISSDVTFRPNGLIMYVVDAAQDRIVQYDLTTAWDISTISFTQQQDFTTTDSGPTAMCFRPDGLACYMTGNEFDNVYEFDVPTAWQITGLTLTNTFGVSSQGTQPNGIDCRSDGYRFYVSDLGTDAIDQYDLTTPWDISTAVFSKSIVTGVTTTGLSVLSRPNRLYYCSADTNSMREMSFGSFEQKFVAQSASSTSTAVVELLDSSGVPQAEFIYNETSDLGELNFLSAGGSDIESAGNFNIFTAIGGDIGIFTGLGASLSLTGQAAVTIASSADVNINSGSTGEVLIDGEVASRVGSTTHEIFTAADLDDLATASVITVTTGLIIEFKEPIVSGVVFVLDGGSLTLKALGSANSYTWIGTGDLFSGTGDIFIDGMTIISGLTGTLLNTTIGPANFLVVQNTQFIGFDDLGSQTGGIFSIEASSNILWGSGFDVINSSLCGVVRGTVILGPSSGAYITIVNTLIAEPVFVFDNVSATLTGSATYLSIDPAISEGSRATITGGFITGGGSMFDQVGDTGTFTAVADAAVAAEAITSVTDSSGVARFNFTAPPTLFVDQEVVISTFVTNTAYNGTFFITATGANFFEVATIPFGTDETGSFLSNSVTLTDTGTTLIDGDTLVIDTDLATDYDGGATVYNQLTNTFQINRTFTATQTGAWDEAPLGHKDPRILAQLQQVEADSKYIATAFVNDNSTANGAIVNNTFTDMVFGTAGVALIEGTTIERWKLIDELNGTFEYTGIEPFDGFITFDFTVISSGGSVDFRFRWQHDVGAGFVDLPDAVEVLQNVGSSSSNATKTFPLRAVTGDQIKPEITRNSGTSGITTMYATIYSTQ